MNRKLTSAALLALLSLGSASADNGQFDAYFSTLPTSEGQGVVTTLNYNNNWTAYLGTYGTSLGKATWGRFNNPWGGNGRVWLECVDAANSLYVLAGQGRYLGGFTDNGDGTALSISTATGDKAKALKFKVEADAVNPNEYHFSYTDGNGEKWWIQALNNRINNLGAKKAVDPETGEPTEDQSTWKLGTWKGVGFAQLDVKTWNGAPEGGSAIKKCEDGFYYGTLCLPFDVQVPAGNLFPDSTAVPEMTNGDKIAAVWQLAENAAGELEVKPMEAGDIVKAGNCILVKATNTQVDFLIAPGSKYVDEADKESLFTGYYAEDAPLNQTEFHLHIDDGYPKFAKSTIVIDEEYENITYTGYDGNVVANIAETDIIKTPGGHRQIAVNIGYIVSNLSNRDFVEYRLDFENNTIQGYENKNYQRMAEVNFSKWLAPENVGGPFQINPADTLALRQVLNEFKGDKTLEDYNALTEEFLKHIVKPDFSFTAIKNNGGNYIGDRNQADKTGMYADFGTPNGANGRAYLKKVSDDQYTIGFNGTYVQAPVDGVQVEKGSEPVAFDVTFIAPNKFLLSKDGIYLSKNGMLQGMEWESEAEEDEEVVYPDAIVWNIDTNYSGFIKSDANVQFEDLRYGTVCAPYALEADNEADPDAAIYVVNYDADDNLKLEEVKTLAPGQAAVIVGQNSPVKLNIVGEDYVATARVPQGDEALFGVLNTLPAEGEIQAPHVLGVVEDTQVVEVDGEPEYVTTSVLGFVTGTPDINQAYIDGYNNTDDIPVIMPDVKWDRQAERQLGSFLTDANVGGAFQVPAEKVNDFKAQIAQVASEEDFNNLKAAMNASVIKPETLFGALKNTQYMGDRNQADGTIGLYANFSTPNGANGRAYLKKVGDDQYTLGFNGNYVQAPVDGANVEKGKEAVTFDLTVVEPGKITLSKDGVYLVANTTLQGGALGDNAYWTIDKNYEGFVKQDAKFQVSESDLYFGTVCVPFTVTVNKEADKAAALYTVSEQGDSLLLTKVEELAAGVPGVVAGANNSVKLNIIGGFVIEPDNSGILQGVLGDKPEIDEADALFLYVNNDKKLVMGYDWLAGDTMFDINKAYILANGYEERAFTFLPTQADGINEVVVKDAKSGAIYNISGQKVNKNFRGLIIVNGKKYLAK